MLNEKSMLCKKKISVRKKYKIYRIMVIILIFLYSLTSFSAIVQNNDGSAFVTKAEFDTLKSSFQAQIDVFNQSIDSKIDDAIAAYLRGIVISKEMQLSSMINQANTSFSYNWSLPTTKKGNCYKGWIYLGAMQAGQDATSKPLECEWKVSNNSGSTGQWKTYGTSTDNDNFYCVDEITVGGDKYFKITKSIKSIPKTGLQVAGWDEQGSTVISSPACNDPTAKTFSYTLDTFGQDNATISFPTLGGGYNKSVEGFLIVDVEDTVLKTSDYFEKMASSPYTTTDTNWCLKNTEYYAVSYSTNASGVRTGNASWASFHPDVGYAWTRYRPGYSSSYTTVYPAGRSNNQLTSTQFNLITVSVYRHHVTSELYSKILNGVVSERLAMPIKYSDGLPLFTAPKSGEVSVKAKFVNTSGVATKFDIKNDSFDNTTAVTGKSVGLTNVVIPSYTVNSGSTVTWKWRAEKGKTYWIKALPTSGDTTITTEEIILIAED